MKHLLCWKTVFFLKNAGELRIIILKRNRGKRTPKTDTVTFRTHTKQKEETTYTSTLHLWCSYGLEKGETLSPGHGPQQGLLPSY
jgi:hypothetical protein